MNKIIFRASNSVNEQIVSSVVMTTVTFQNGRKLTFNITYFANEFGEPNYFCSLSNKYADLKTNSVYPIFIKTKKTLISYCKENYLHYPFFLKSACSILKGEESF